MNGFYNLYFPFCALLLSLLVLIIYYTKRNVNNEETVIYSKQLIVNVLESLIGVIIVISAIYNIPLFYLKILNKIDYLLIFCWVYLLFKYVFISTKSNEKSLIFYKIINIIICFVICVTDVKVINENGIMNSEGESTSILFITVAIYILIIFIKTIIGLCKKKINIKKFIPIYILIILIVLMMIIRLIIPEVNMLTFIVSFITLTMYFTIENPDLKLINVLLKNRELVENQMQDKSDFLFEMSQSIKIPAKNIMELTKTYYKLNDQLDKNDVIRLIGDNANELIFKTNNILDVSSMDASKISIIESDFEFYKLMEQIKVLSKNKIRNDKVKLEFNINSNIPKIISGDQIRLKQILMSVISNSINNTKEGFINVNVDSINKYNVARLIIKVEDTGVGIELEKVNSILDNPNNLTKEEIMKIDKLDVSLSVAIKMIKLLNGNINIKSIPKKGTITTIILDQKYEEETDTIFKSVEKYSQFVFDKKKVLIVDSNKEETFVIKNILGKYNFDVTSTLMGTDVSKKITSNKKYDVIIIDDELEETSALEVLKKLKENKIKIPVIVMLEKNKEHFKDDYIESGFSDYILKNNMTEELKRIFEKEN